MAIIYTYPTKATPANDDLILISDSADSNKTKQVTVASIKGQTAGVTSIVAGNNVTISSTGASGTGDVTVNATGGSGTPDLPLNSIQFNNNSAFGGSLNFTYNNTSNTLTIGDNSGIAGILELKASSSTTPVLKLQDLVNQNFVTIRAADDTSNNYTIYLPDSGPGGNDKILQSDTNGNLSWITTPASVAYSAGTGLALNGTTFSLASGAALTNLGGGTGTTFLRKDGTWQTAGGAVTSYTNPGNNYILTSSGAGIINGESSLLYNGSILTLGTSKVFNASRSTVTAGVATAPIYVTNSTLSSGAPTNFASNIAGGNGSRHIEFYHQGTSVGSITSTTGGIQINGETSDERKKKNIVDWTENVLDKFALIEPKKFNFTHQDDSDPLIKGFIAQQMVDKFPEAYNHDYSISDTEGYYSFNAMGMNIYLMKAIKELKEEIDSLKSRVSTLEG